MSGKRAQFSTEENAILRARLRDHADRATQKATADALGITQQNISALLAGRNGFARSTANNLAALEGYGSAELLLATAEVERSMASGMTGWERRDAAVRLAGALGYDEAAVARVVARYAEPADKSRPPKWWIMKFGDEERDGYTQAVTVRR